LSSSYALSPLAQADLSDIWDYSYSQWGAGLADAYVLAIHAALEGLVTAVANGRLFV
jgi:toxin ParE1/3/4